jgi:membrane associated rhomboid family serine protease
LGVAAIVGVAVSDRPHTIIYLPSRAPTGVPELRESAEATDIAVILSVPAVLVLVQLLPDSVRGALVLNYGSPGVVQAYTTQFVHAGFGHLAGNVVVYLVAVALVYPLVVYADARRTFYAAFALVLLVVPFPVSFMDLYLVGPTAGDVPTRGFSGLASAFVGFLPVAVFVFLRENLSEEVRVYESMGLFLAALGVVLLVLNGPTDPTALLSLSLGFLYYVPVLRRLDVGAREEFQDWTLPKQALVVYAVLFFLVSPVILFPANPAQGDTVVNLVTHFGGFFMGYIITTVSANVLLWNQWFD